MNDLKKTVNHNKYAIVKALKSLKQDIQGNQLEQVPERLNTLFGQVLARGDENDIGKTHMLKGLYHSKLGQYIQGIEQYHLARNMFRKQVKSRDYLDACNNLAGLYVEIGEEEKALKYYFEVIEVSNETGKYLVSRGKVANNIGIIYNKWEDYVHAIQFYSESYSIYKKEQLHHTLPIVTYNLATAYFSLEQYDQAELYANESLMYANEMESVIDQLFAALIIETLAYMKHGQVDDFKSKYQAILKDMHDHGDLIDFMEAVNWLSKAMVQLELYHLAKDILESNYYKVKSSEMSDMKSRLMKRLELVYVQLEDYRAAYEFRINEERNQKPNTEVNLLRTGVREDYEQLKDQGYVMDLENGLRLFRLLSKIGEGITLNQDIPGIFQHIIEQIFDIWDMDSFGLAVTGEDKMSIDYYLFDKQTGTRMYKLSMNHDELLMVYCMTRKEELIIQDTAMLSRYKKRFPEEIIEAIERADVRSLIYMPLKAEDVVIGGITVQSGISEYFTTKDLEIMRSLGSYCAAAISNYKRHLTLLKSKDIDGLTGIFNRHALITKNNEIEHAPSLVETPLLMAMFDVDYFKDYNDHYGHIAGDQCLIQLTQIVNRVVQSYGGQLYRFGGDEFSILIEGIDALKAKECLEAMIQGVADLKLIHEYHPSSECMTISMGAILINQLESPVIDYSKKVDQLLYDVKNHGRGNYRFSIIEKL